MPSPAGTSSLGCAGAPGLGAATAQAPGGRIGWSGEGDRRQEVPSCRAPLNAGQVAGRGEKFFWSLYSLLVVKGASRAQAGLVGDNGAPRVQGRGLESKSSHTCLWPILASSDLLSLYSSHHPITTTTGLMQGDLSICIPPALAAPDNSTWENKAAGRDALDSGLGCA